MPETLELPPALMHSLLAQAGARPGEEICGLLSGRGRRIERVHAIPNAAAETAERFCMAPEDLLRAFKQMRERGEQLLGIYHSHPNGVAEPSARDLEEAAYPDVAYLIIALENDPPVRAFLYDGRRFSAMELAMR